MQERLQKVLARAGIGSRRGCEELIAGGQVEVNGQVVTEMGVKVDPSADRIKVSGQPLQRNQPVYLLLNKPPEVITSLDDPEGRPTVVDLLPAGMPRAYPVGRLDWDTQGVLLVTNDGDLANRLLHPSHEILKVYRAKVKGHPSPAVLQELSAGVLLDDGTRTASADIELLSANPTNAWVRLIIFEGRNHQVKRMFEAVGHPVIKLRRDSFAGLTSEGIKVGGYRLLTRGEVNELREKVGLPPLPARGPRGDLWSDARGSRNPAPRRRPASENGAPRPPRETPFGPWHPRRQSGTSHEPERPAAELEEQSARRPAREEPPRPAKVRRIIRAAGRQEKK